MRIDLTGIEAGRRTTRAWARVAHTAVHEVTGTRYEVADSRLGVVPVASVRTDQEAPTCIRTSAGSASITCAGPDRATIPNRAIRSIGEVILRRLSSEAVQSDLPSGQRSAASQADTFLTCQFEVPALALTYDLALPVGTPFDRLWAPVPVEELTTFASHLAAGVAESGRHATIVRGRQLAVTPEAIRFPTRSSIEAGIAHPDRVGFIAGLSEPPGGFLALTVERDVARRLDRAVASEIGLGRDGIVHGSVIDLGDAVVRGTLTGWTGVLSDGIDCAAPRTVGPTTDHDVLRDHSEWLDELRTHGVLVHLTIREDQIDIPCDIAVMPNESSFLEHLDQTENTHDFTGRNASRAEARRDAEKYHP